MHIIKYFKIVKKDLLIDKINSYIWFNIIKQTINNDYYKTQNRYKNKKFKNIQLQFKIKILHTSTILN